MTEIHDNTIIKLSGDIMQIMSKVNANDIPSLLRKKEGTYYTRS